MKMCFPSRCHSSCMVHWWLLVHSGNKIVHMDEDDLCMQRMKFHICTNELLVLLTSCEAASRSFFSGLLGLQWTTLIGPSEKKILKLWTLSQIEAWTPKIKLQKPYPFGPPRYIGYESSTLSTGYGIKCSGIGNIMGNASGTWCEPIENLMGTNWKHQNPQNPNLPVLPPLIGCQEFLFLAVFMIHFCLP
jgi:hypothetical protein